MRGRIALESFDFRGSPITYEHTGQGEPVIMLHNGGSSHAIWEEVANRLAGKYEIFALDLLGFGNSAKPYPDATLPMPRSISPNWSTLPAPISGSGCARRRCSATCPIQVSRCCGTCLREAAVLAGAARVTPSRRGVPTPAVASRRSRPGIVRRRRPHAPRALSPACRKRAG